jgi:hypothetical protein
VFEAGGKLDVECIALLEDESNDVIFAELDNELKGVLLERTELEENDTPISDKPPGSPDSPLEAVDEEELKRGSVSELGLL